MLLTVGGVRGEGSELLRSTSDLCCCRQATWCVLERCQGDISHRKRVLEAQVSITSACVQAVPQNCCCCTKL
jgi:hypothetical protein